MTQTRLRRSLQLWESSPIQLLSSKRHSIVRYLTRRKYRSTMGCVLYRLSLSLPLQENHRAGQWSLLRIDSFLFLRLRIKRLVKSLLLTTRFESWRIQAPLIRRIVIPRSSISSIWIPFFIHWWILFDLRLTLLRKNWRSTMNWKRSFFVNRTRNERNHQEKLKVKRSDRRWKSRVCNRFEAHRESINSSLIIIVRTDWLDSFGHCHFVSRGQFTGRDEQEEEESEFG